MNFLSKFAKQVILDCNINTVQPFLITIMPVFFFRGRHIDTEGVVLSCATISRKRPLRIRDHL